jgi:hypothetical protein
MKFDGYKLRGEHLDDVFAEVEKALGLRLDHSGIAYGTQGATIGLPTKAGTWVRVAWSAPDLVHRQAWTGGETAAAIVGVNKPRLYRSYRWIDEDRSVVWRADEVELVTSNAVHPAGVIDQDPELPATWWENLKSSLAALAEFSTRRVGMAQEHLTRRINQVFEEDGLDTEVEEWTTAHADLHWGNVTAPDCYLLDWEDWGLAPRGLDAATLWGHSLGVPAVAETIQELFVDDLGTRSGRLAQLLFCSNVIRINSSKPSPSPLLDPARREADRLLTTLQ